jgi:hypothetical protein
VLFSADGNPVDEYIELGGYYEAADGGSYTFEDTTVRVQFDAYQVLRLKKRLPFTALFIAVISGLFVISMVVLLRIVRSRRKTRRCNVSEL